jgi:hypothetical protein
MKKTITTGTCTAIVGFATAALFAQPPAPQTTTPSAADTNKVTITGCLKAAPGSETAGTSGAAGTAGATGTTGTTSGATGTAGASDASNASYVLTDATVKPADSPAAGSTTPAETTTGGATTAAAAGSGQTYRLIANPSALTAHVGKKLELTGTLENGNAGSTGSTAPAGTTATTASNAQGPALRVESGKVLAASCSQQ